MPELPQPTEPIITGPLPRLLLQNLGACTLELIRVVRALEVVELSLCPLLSAAELQTYDEACVAIRAAVESVRLRWKPSAASPAAPDDPKNPKP